MRMRPEMEVFERHVIRGAIRLGRLLNDLMPGEPEVISLDPKNLDECATKPAP